MPDIAMCASPDCPLAARCIRHEASGTEPTRVVGHVRQNWNTYHWRRDSFGERVTCGGFWSIEARPESAPCG